MQAPPKSKNLIQQLVKGAEPWDMITVSDSREYRGLPLARSIVLAALKRKMRIAAVLYEQTSHSFLSSIPKEYHSHVHCFESLPEPVDPGQLNSLDPNSVAQAVLDVKKKHKVEKNELMLVIDSVARYILRHSIQTLCHTLVNTIEIEYTKAVVIIHKDTSDWTTVAKLKHVSNASFDVSTSGTGGRGKCKATYVRPSGKVLSEERNLIVSEAGECILQTVEKGLSDALGGGGDHGDNEIDANLTTFNLGLAGSNEQEREAKASAKPYTLSEAEKSDRLNQGAGRIFYQPDDGDDFDDEDPDDDLDI